MVRIEKILFPSDLSDFSSQILPFVLSMAEKYNAKIYLLHVTEDLTKWAGFYLPHVSLEIYQKEVMQAADKFLETVCEEKMQGCPNFERRILAGDPAKEILKTIERDNIDLVIMGTHGYKGLEATFFGSVANKVVKNSMAPVLVINPERIK
jgi:nucleotide-binding universal stress UspA family protein